MDFTKFETMITDTVPWIKMSDVRVDLLAERHAKLSLPIQKHLNHVGIVYAGTHFMLMELTGAALFLCTYGFEKYVPVNKQMSIQYLKPAYSDLTCEVSLSREEALEKMQPIVEHGKGDWILDMNTVDSSGQVVSRSTCNYFIIPTPDTVKKA